MWHQCVVILLPLKSVAVVSDNLCSLPGFCILGFSRYDADDGDHGGVDDDDEYYGDYASRC